MGGGVRVELPLVLDSTDESVCGGRPGRRLCGRHGCVSVLVCVWGDRGWSRRGVGLAVGAGARELVATDIDPWSVPFEGPRGVTSSASRHVKMLWRPLAGLRRRARGLCGVGAVTLIVLSQARFHPLPPSPLRPALAPSSWSSSSSSSLRPHPNLPHPTQAPLQATTTPSPPWPRETKSLPQITTPVAISRST